MCSHPQQHPQTGVTFHVPRRVICLHPTLQHYIWGTNTMLQPSRDGGCAVAQTYTMYKRRRHNTAECTKFEEIVFTLKAYQPASRLLMCIAFTAPYRYSCPVAQHEYSLSVSLSLSVYRIRCSRATFMGGFQMGIYREWVVV